MTLDQQVSGERVFDLNTDGVAHYGLYPDWVADLRLIAGDEIIRDMGRGAEAYLQMWERTYGVPEVSWAGGSNGSSPRAASARSSGSARATVGSSTAPGSR